MALGTFAGHSGHTNLGHGGGAGQGFGAGQTSGGQRGRGHGGHSPTFIGRDAVHTHGGHLGIADLRTYCDISGCGGIVERSIYWLKSGNCGTVADYIGDVNPSFVDVVDDFSVELNPSTTPHLLHVPVPYITD